MNAPYEPEHDREDYAERQSESADEARLAKLSKAEHVLRLNLKPALVVWEDVEGHLVLVVPESSLGTPRAEIDFIEGAYVATVWRDSELAREIVDADPLMVSLVLACWLEHERINRWLTDRAHAADDFMEEQT
jgi:hypothetical protein